MAKDWIGGKASTFKTIGASNHCDHERQEHDYYATEPFATELLCEVECLAPNVWEPACGEGHMADVLKDNHYNVRATDLIDRGYGDVMDFLSADEKWNGDIVTNPPYKYAQEFVEKALSIIPDGRKVCMFLKLTFLEGKKRRELFRNYPPPSYLCQLKSLEVCHEWRLRECRRKRNMLRLVRVDERIYRCSASALD